MNEQKLVGSSYIVNFYNEVQTLNHYYAEYINLLLELENKLGGAELTALQDTERGAVLKNSQIIRYNINRSMVMYTNIIGAIGKGNKVDPQIVKLYNEIKDQLVINRDKLQEFVLAINGVLIKDIIKDLLNTSNQFLEGVYKDDTTE